MISMVKSSRLQNATDVIKLDSLRDIPIVYARYCTNIHIVDDNAKAWATHDILDLAAQRKACSNNAQRVTRSINNFEERLPTDSQACYRSNVPHLDCLQRFEQAIPNRR